MSKSQKLATSWRCSVWSRLSSFAHVVKRALSCVSGDSLSHSKGDSYCKHLSSRILPMISEGSLQILPFQFALMKRLEKIRTCSEMRFCYLLRLGKSWRSHTWSSSYWRAWSRFAWSLYNSWQNTSEDTAPPRLLTLIKISLNGVSYLLSRPVLRVLPLS